jgi:hypothetical protein
MQEKRGVELILALKQAAEAEVLDGFEAAL